MQINLTKLIDLVENRHFTLQQLSSHFKIPISTIRYHMAKNNIRTRHDKAIKPPVEELVRLANKGMNPNQIALELCKERTTIVRWLKMYGIETKEGKSTNQKVTEQKESDAIQISEIRINHKIGEQVKVTGEFQSPDGNVKLHSRLGRVFKKNRDVITIRFENYAESFQNKDVARKAVRIERMK